VTKKKRPLDKLLVEKGLAPAEEQARPLIMAGKVIVDDHMVDKPGTPVSPHAHIRLRDMPGAYVGRGGQKLEKPLDLFTITLTDKTVIDVGASTGGFTDCLLQRGASRVFAVDVGYGQLAWKLQQDERVVNLERTNIRQLSPNRLQPPPHLAVVDVSFISVKKILPHLIALLRPDGEILSLIKPQFEAKRQAVERGGIVSDKKQYQKIIQDIAQTAMGLSLHLIGVTESPVPGHKGNREFFLYAKKTAKG